MLAAAEPHPGGSVQVNANMGFSLDYVHFW